MLHAHDFAPAPRRRPLPRVPDATPLTASAYLVLRRQAAGLTQQQLADRMAALYRAERAAGGTGIAIERPVDKHMLYVVRALELDGGRARQRATIDAIAAVMPLDVDVYFQLADCPPYRHPRVCRGCGCSQHDACHHDDFGACAWDTPTNCTHCAHRAASVGQAA